MSTKAAIFITVNIQNDVKTYIDLKAVISYNKDYYDKIDWLSSIHFSPIGHGLVF